MAVLEQQILFFRDEELLTLHEILCQTPTALIHKSARWLHLEAGQGESLFRNFKYKMYYLVRGGAKKEVIISANELNIVYYSIGLLKKRDLEPSRIDELMENPLVCVNEYRKLLRGLMEME